MVTLIISGGNSFQLNWEEGMNVQNALESAYIQNNTNFTYSIQYYGSLGYLVDMINETYDTFISKYEPFFFWELYVNGTIATNGIDFTNLSDGDVVEFVYTVYSGSISANSTLHNKYNVKKMRN